MADTPGIHDTRTHPRSGRPVRYILLAALIGLFCVALVGVALYVFARTPNRLLFAFPATPPATSTPSISPC